MDGIRISNLSKRFGEVDALADIDLDVDEGELLVLLGPSGCGKTTTLRCIAGLERPNSGEIQLGDRFVYSETRQIDIAAKDRGVGLVFQNYALYPHMTVYNNIAFGLRMRSYPKSEIPARVQEALRLVELEGYERRRPRELSGGQQQRVAVARMIAGRPEFLLFDEPLSNLDPKLRNTVREQLKKLHAKMGATSVYVTHDQTEAALLADRIAVLDKGKIVQIDDADTLYHFPATVAIADFTGNPKTNLIRGEIHRSADSTLLLPEVDPYCFIPLPPECREYAGQKMVVHGRPEDIDIVTSPGEEEGTLEVMAVMNEGPSTFIHLCFEDRHTQVIARSGSRDHADLEPGRRVGFRFRRGNIYDGATERLADSFGYETG